MISNQVLQTTIDGLKSITRIDICVMDTEGKALATTINNVEDYEEAVMTFVDSPADSQVLQGYQFFKVFDEHQLEYVLLAKGDITVHMEDYASMEKVGSLGTSLPRNDRPTTTSAGDLILYQGHNLVLYYDVNSWNFTRLGKIEGVSGKELLDALGRGDVTITLSMDADNE